MGKLTLDEYGPPFQQVAARIAEAVSRREYAPGDKLPSLTTLAGQHGVAIGTVRSALGLLRDKGIVVTRAGSGSFVRSDLDPARVQDALQPNGSSDLDQVVSLLREICDRLTAIEQRLP